MRLLSKGLVGPGGGWFLVTKAQGATAERRPHVRPCHLPLRPPRDLRPAFPAPSLHRSLVRRGGFSAALGQKRSRAGTRTFASRSSSALPGRALVRPAEGARPRLSRPRADAHDGDTRSRPATRRGAVAHEPSRRRVRQVACSWRRPPLARARRPRFESVVTLKSARIWVRWLLDRPRIERPLSQLQSRHPSPSAPVS